MYEIDFLPVGDGKDSGDAIAIRFTRPSGDRTHVILDAGFKDDGEALVEHVQRYYQTDHIDLAIQTHPDGDHIGGMGVVLRELRVDSLCVHDLGARGGASLPAADAVDELMDVARQQGTTVYEPFAGGHAFDAALTILGPTERYYEQLVEEQLALTASATRGGATLVEAAKAVGQRLLAALPVEIPFDDGEGTNPRNNSSVITMLEVDGRRFVFTADAGVPALDRAWDYVEVHRANPASPYFVQMPHHGSRRNASSSVLDRILGPIGGGQSGVSYVSVAENADSKHPSPRVANAYARRGYKVIQTAGRAIRNSSPDAPSRAGWGPVEPLGPLDEFDEDS